jgi:hypothetical protein
MNRGHVHVDPPNRFTQAGCFFITRAKPKFEYRSIKSQRVDPLSNVKSDHAAQWVSRSAPAELPRAAAERFFRQIGITLHTCQ